jgi:hypothetical protein
MNKKDKSLIYKVTRNSGEIIIHGKAYKNANIALALFDGIKYYRHCSRRYKTNIVDIFKRLYAFVEECKENTKKMNIVNFLLLMRKKFIETYPDFDIFITKGKLIHEDTEKYDKSEYDTEYCVSGRDYAKVEEFVFLQSKKTLIDNYYKFEKAGKGSYHFDRYDEFNEGKNQRIIDLIILENDEVAFRWCNRSSFSNIGPCNNRGYPTYDYVRVKDNTFYNCLIEGLKKYDPNKYGKDKEKTLIKKFNKLYKKANKRFDDDMDRKGNSNNVPDGYFLDNFEDEFEGYGIAWYSSCYIIPNTSQLFATHCSYYYDENKKIIYIFEIGSGEQIEYVLGK